MATGKDSSSPQDEAYLDLLDLEAVLDELTAGWTRPSVVRVYALDEAGDEDFQDEVEILAGHGYEPSTQGVDGGHIHVGRLLLTGGLSVFAGRVGIRSEGLLTVTFAKRQEASRARGSADDVFSSIERLGTLRDAGLVTPEEFEAKKGELLSRL